MRNSQPIITSLSALSILALVSSGIVGCSPSKQTTDVKESKLANSAADKHLILKVKRQDVKQFLKRDDAYLVAPPESMFVFIVKPPFRINQMHTTFNQRVEKGARLFDVIADSEESLLLAQENLGVAKVKFERNRNSEPLKGEVQAWEAIYQAVKTGKKSATIKTPISGLISGLSLKSQTDPMVARDQSITIVDTNKMHVEVPLDQKTDTIKKGTPVLLNFSSAPAGNFNGTVSEIGASSSPAKKGTNVLKIKFAGDQSVRPEAKVTLCAFTIGEAKDVLTVPNKAVTTSPDGRHSVEVLDGTSWIRRDVEIGLVGGSYTEIKSGLEEGERIRVPVSL